MVEEKDNLFSNWKKFYLFVKIQAILKKSLKYISKCVGTSFAENFYKYVIILKYFRKNREILSNFCENFAKI